MSKEFMAKFAVAAVKVSALAGVEVTNSENTKGAVSHKLTAQRHDRLSLARLYEK